MDGFGFLVLWRFCGDSIVAKVLGNAPKGGRREKILLNYSSGAGEFKRRKGGEPCLEWNALYTRHLPAGRRMTYSILGLLLNRFGRRFLEKHKI